MKFLLPLLIIATASGVPIADRYPDAKQVFYCDFCDSWDKNFDAWPDGWTRRRGSGYPHFVDVKVCHEPSPVGNRCLRIDLNSGAAVAYSPVIAVSPLYSYVAEGQLKTEGLCHDRAFISLTILDGKQRRLKTYYSEPFKTTGDWTKIRIGPIAPQDEHSRGAVIGLHLQPCGGQYAADSPALRNRTDKGDIQSKSANPLDPSAQDLHGAALFDDIWMGRLPRMSLSTNSPGCVFNNPKNVRIKCRASGFSQESPRVEFFLEDHAGRLVARHECGFDTADQSRHAESLLDVLSDEPVGRLGTAIWEPPTVEPGFYRVRAELKGMEHLSTIHRMQETSFVLIDDPLQLPNSEFGWSLPRGDRPLMFAELFRILSQMGVGYIKYPLWYGEERAESEIEALCRFAERLNSRGVGLIGVLSNPPREVNVEVAGGNDLQAADIFTSNPSAWLPSVEAVLTRFANRVSWWQLGADSDTSFVDCINLGGNLSKVKAELDRIDHDISLGIAWSWLNQLPPGDKKRPSACRFISLSAEPPFTHEELEAYLAKGRHLLEKPDDAADAASDAKLKLAVVLKPIDKERYDTQTRVNDLVRRMMTAKINGADAITTTDPFDDRHGLFTADGLPDELLLPWRFTAQTLEGSQYFGQIRLPNGSPNRIFSRGDTAVMVVWNEAPCEETIFLGENVYQLDVWGRKTTPMLDGRRQIINVGPTPSFVIGLNKNICAWRMGFEFVKPRVASIPGRELRGGFRITNTFPGGVSGRIELSADKTWKIHPAEIILNLVEGEQYEQPFTLMLPYDVLTGDYNVRIDCAVQAKQLWQFSIYRNITVGLDDVYIEHYTEFDDEGNLRVVQRFVNNSRHRVGYRCQLSAPGRRRMGTRIVNFPRGTNIKTYVLPDGKELIGKTLWLRASEIDGQRKLNYKFVVEGHGR